jgi:aspartyl-tRNA(Asn)/glutamyl-tRNA(Gln) amidotransferase subunit C
MTETALNTLSSSHLADLLARAKLTTLSEDEEALDKSYLAAMIASAMRIDSIADDHLQPTTHAFEVEQRMRDDAVTDTEDHREIYQRLMPTMVHGLYTVPVVIE